MMYELINITYVMNIYKLDLVLGQIILLIYKNVLNEEDSLRNVQKLFIINDNQRIIMSIEDLKDEGYART